VVGEDFVDVRRTIHNGRAKVFVRSYNQDVLGFLECTEQGVLVRHKVGRASCLLFEEAKNASLELSHTDLEFGWDGIKRWVPVGANKEFCRG
jgi:hypothetical protein